MTEKATVLERVCIALAEGEPARAATIARTDYPFISPTNADRKYTELQSLRIFHRDGFVDRYSGQRLLFPGTLRLLSQLLPAEFPFHPNWKMSESHFAFWELFPTVDHLVPVARGGCDDETNWITTSMLRNAAKSNWTLDELGWTLRPPGDAREWDGLTGWFLDFVAREPERLESAYLRRWLLAAMRIDGSASVANDDADTCR